MNTINDYNIGLDIDGVLADFNLAWHELYPEFPSRPDDYNRDKKMGQRFIDMKASGTLDNFFLNIKPLIKPEDLSFEPCCYLTARPVDSEVTEKWLEKNGFPKKKVITVGSNMSKLNAAKDAGIEIFIDDYYGNFVELNKGGVVTYLYTAAWNLKYDVGHLRINSLSDLPFLKKQRI